MNSIRDELIWLVLCILVSLVISVLAVWFTWNNQDKSQTPLYDVMFELLPDWSDISLPIPNYIFFTQALVVLVGIKEPKYKYACQHLFLNFLLLFTRSFTVSSTLMPNIHIYDFCKKRPDNFFEVVGLILQYGTCSDYMFSGHTAASMLLYMFSHKHKQYYAVEFINGILLGSTIFTLLVLRWHYTSDILIAIIIVWLLFKLYKDYEEKSDAWFYFHSLKNLNWRCQRTTRKERTDFSRSIQPVGQK